MPRVEIEIDDKGELLGSAPAELDAIFKRIEAEHHKVGYGKGVEQAAKDAKKQIEDTVALELARKAALDPLEKERVSRIETENASLAAKLADTSRESDRLIKSREESHARETVAAAERLKLREGRIRDLTKQQIRADAKAAGARDESLDELEIILNNYVGFDDDMMPVVKGADGTAMLQHGKPVALSAFVQQYVENHPHHRKPVNGRGGEMRRGASFNSGGGANTLDAARSRIEKDNDRSAGAINDLFNASRKSSAA